MSARSERIAEVEAVFLEYLSRHHPTQQERGAVRCGLGDAAVICDLMAEAIRKSNPGRKKGSTSQTGEALADVAKQCGNAIAAYRDKVTVA